MFQYSWNKWKKKFQQRKDIKKNPTLQLKNTTFKIKNSLAGSKAEWRWQKKSVNLNTGQLKRSNLKSKEKRIYQKIKIGKQSLEEVWDNTKISNFHVIIVPEGESKDYSAGKKPQKLANNGRKLPKSRGRQKPMNLRSLAKPKQVNSKKSMPRHIVKPMYWM